MQIKKQFEFLLILISFFLVASTGSISANAEDKAASDVADQTGYSVEAIQPDTQIDKNYSFFYIHAEPDEEQTLKVKITSKRKEPCKVKISLNNATTSTSGQVVYGNEKNLLDDSLDYPLTDIAKVVEKEVTVKDFEEKIVEIKVKPPKEAFQGVRLGAIAFQGVEEESTSGGVNNTYGYKIGLMVNEDLRPFNEGGQIKYKKVRAILRRGEKVIATTVQNPEPKVLENVTMQMKVTRKGEEEVLYSNGLANMKLAPNSSFDFLLYTGIEDLVPGKYILTATATDGKENWNWEKEFEITNKQANQINKDAAYKITMPRLYKIIGVILFVLTTGNIIYLIYRRKTQQGGGKDDAKEE